MAEEILLPDAVGTGSWISPSADFLFAYNDPTDTGEQTFLFADSVNPNNGLPVSKAVLSIRASTLPVGNLKSRLKIGGTWTAIQNLPFIATQTAQTATFNGVWTIGDFDSLELGIEFEESPAIANFFGATTVTITIGETAFSFDVDVIPRYQFDVRLET